MKSSNFNKNHLITILVLIIGVLSGVLITLVWPLLQNDKLSGAFTKNKIPFSESVSLKVGESLVIHGKKGKCGKLPPSAEKIARKLPKDLKTGELRVGELGVRYSNKCSGVTPAREIIFKATSSGTETVNLYDDDILISVTSESQNDKLSGAFTKNKIPFSKSVSLKVGESLVIHGKKGKCGKLPRSAEKIMRKLPKNLKTGELRVGELGVRNSNKCGGVTPAREIIFKATSPGTETVSLYDDDILISVTSD